MKKYKHLPTGKIALELESNTIADSHYKLINTNSHPYIPKFFVDNCKDWVEIESCPNCVNDKCVEQCIPNKEWQITAFKDNIKGGIWVSYDSYHWKNNIDDITHTYLHLINLLGKFTEIYSVRRKLDGEIFTIGDKVKSHFGIGTIKSFTKEAFGKGYVINCVESFNCEEGVQKVEKLFTTEDGVGIYKNDRFYWFCELETVGGSKPFKIECIEEAFGFAKDFDNKYKVHNFSNKEKAEEYILLNKPCLSIMDIVNKSYEGDSNKWGGIGMPMLSLNKMKELVKTKL